MKKLALAVLMVATMYSSVWADCTEKFEMRGLDLEVITLACTTAADGTFANYILTSPFIGAIWYVATNPGSPAPTDNYDITLLNSDGYDVAGGQLADRDTADTEEIKLSTPRPIYDTLTLTISNNSQASAVIVIRLWFGR